MKSFLAKMLTPFAFQIRLMQRIYEKFAPEAVLDPNAPNHWQEKVLYFFVLISVSVGFVVYVLGIYGNISHDYWIIFLAVSVGYFLSLLIFFFPSISFTLRAALICLSLYFIGLSIILTVGPFYSSREWLFSFTLLAAILLGWTGSIAAMIVNLATWIVIAILIQVGYWDGIFDRAEGMHYWFMITIDLLFILVSTTILITLFFLRIDESDRSAKTSSQLLLAERDKLAQEIEDRKKVTLALEASEEKYRTILETIEDAYFEVDVQGRFLFFNHALEDLLEYSKEELMQMNARDLLDAASLEKISGLLRSVLDGGKFGRPVDLLIKGKEHTEKTMSVLVSLIRASDGQATGFRGIARDITEYKMMESRLQRARKMEALGTLAGGVAHDLNNTLSGIVNYPELLLMNMSPTDPLRKPITDMKASGEKAAAIVQDLLALARRGVAVKEIVNFNALVNEYLQSPEFMNLKAYYPDVHFETKLEPSLLNQNASPVHLSKTLMNLIINAAEAIVGEGTVIVSTENRHVDSASAVANLRPGDYAVLSVQDTGMGIAPQDLDKIFEPFFTKKVMGRSGTGLGMAVVWGTVEDHGGHIEVQSVIGQGTHFTLYFPATRIEEMKKEPVLTIDALRGNGESILVVDDMASQRDIASRILSSLGYQPVTVNSGEEAVAYLAAQPVDLMLLDMIMRPGIDGLETYRQVIAVRPGQKAIITSGYSETDRVREAQALGAGVYIRKPYSMEKLGLAIKKELYPASHREGMGDGQ